MRGFQSIFLLDPRDAQRWLEEEQTKPRIAEAPNLRFLLEDQAAQCLWWMGDASGFRRIAEQHSDARANTSRYTLAYFDGDVEAMEAWRAGYRHELELTGNRFQLGAWLNFEAMYLYLRGEFESAARLFAESAEIPHSFAEAWNHDGLAMSYAHLGRPRDARRHAERVRAIVGSGAGWRGASCTVPQSDAMASAAEGDFDAADRLFAEAVEITRNYSVVLVELGMLRDWAWARALAGDVHGANEKLDEADEMCRRHGMGQWWLDRVEAERPN
jgi:tetratricopeptide (TPR) repeat protein